MHFDPGNMARAVTSLTGSGWVAYGGLWWFLPQAAAGLGIWPIVILVPATAFSVIFWYFDRRDHNRHHEQMAGFAAQHGWQYRGNDGTWFQHLDVYPFRTGERRQAEAILTGEFGGFECSTFVQSFFRTEGGPTPSSPEVYQITTVRLPETLGRVDIFPEDVPDKVAKAIGGQDIEFESAAFNPRWRVKSPDPRFAHAFLHPRMLHRLELHDAWGLRIRLEKDTLLCWQHGRASQDTLAKRLSVLVGMARLVPEHLYRDARDRREHAAQNHAAEVQILRQRIIDGGGIPPAALDVPPEDLTAEQLYQLRRQASDDDLSADAPAWARDSSSLTDGKFNPEFLSPEDRADWERHLRDRGEK